MSSIPPPVPPLPTQATVPLHPEYRPSPPHLEEPLLAPRPHKLTPDLPAEARPITPRVTVLSLTCAFRWHALLTVKSPAHPPKHWQITPTAHLLSPLARSTLRPVSLCLHRTQVHRLFPLLQGLPGVPGIFPSPVQHLHSNLASHLTHDFQIQPGSLLIDLRNLIFLPHDHYPMLDPLPSRIPLCLQWLPSPSQTPLRRRFPS
jgi:hypothetical protein